MTISLPMLSKLGVRIMYIESELFNSIKDGFPERVPTELMEIAAKYPDAICSGGIVLFEYKGEIKKRENGQGYRMFDLEDME